MSDLNDSGLNDSGQTNHGEQGRTIDDVLAKKVPLGNKLPHPDSWKGDFGKNNAAKVFISRAQMYKSIGAKGRRLTEKQASYVNYLAQGYSKRESMLRAGYSPKSVKANYVYLSKSPAVSEAIETLNDKLEKAGLNDVLRSKKLLEWINAERKTDGGSEPDYDTQLRAWDKWHDIIKKLQPGKVTRRVTLEEFINEDVPKKDDL